jgi:hydrogenase nickel incorporation protein HypA/HybF
MHEIGLIQELLATVLEHAARQGAQHIDRVIIRVGAESGVAPEVLSFVFDLLKRDTPAAQASIEIEHVPVVCWCPVCDQEFSPSDALHSCPRCHLPGASVRRGYEFALVALEVS